MEEIPELEPIPIVHQQAYHALLGVFHSNWSAIDLHTDIAIKQFLGVTAEQAHLITSGMVWGRKARLLVDLIGHSADPRRPALMTALNRIRAAKRDIIAHSYVASDAIHVTFLERLTSGPFKIKEHVFTLKEFGEHARAVHDDALAFSAALGVSQDDINAFVKAAFNLERKESTSPESPSSSR